MEEIKVRETVDTARVFFNNDAERRQYINREMAIMDYNSNMKGAREEGREEAQLAVAKRMIARKKYEPEEIADLSGLSLAKIHELIAGQSA